MNRFSTRSVLGYVMAVVTVAMTTALKLPLSRIYKEEETPFLLYFAAITLSAWYSGLGPGLLATVLAAAVSSFFFGEESRAGWQIFRIAFFLIEGVLVSSLAGLMHAARGRAERNELVARDLKKTVTEVSEAEQRRLGRELHDGLGQHLTGVALLSRFLSQKLIAAGRPEAPTASEVAGLVEESIDWTRDLARGLSPMDLDRTNLPSALRELATKTTRLCRIPCTFEGVERLKLGSDETTLNLYRVAQEAVNNAVKHAKPTRISVRLVLEGSDVVLQIADDGFGLNTSAGVKPVSAQSGVWGGSGEGGKGMGLEIMRYRAGVVGGTLDFRPANGQGTIIECRVPLSFAANPSSPAHVDSVESAPLHFT